MRNIGNDIRYALRRLGAAKGYTIFAIVTLAIGIGSATAICSAVLSLYSAYGIHDIDHVVNIYHKQLPGSGPMIWLSWPDYLDLRSQQTQFSQVTAWTPFRQAISGDGPTERFSGEAVGGEYFAFVGARSEMGRLLQPADDRAGAPAVVVISHAFWKRWLGGDPAVVGKKVRIAGAIAEVVGVVESNFKGVFQPTILPTPVWVPLAFAFRIDPGLAKESEDREGRMFSVKARLRPGSTLSAARAEVAAIGSQLDMAVPIGQDLESRFKMPYNISRKWVVIPASEIHVSELADFVVVPITIGIFVAVVLVLLVACTNLANLALARASLRRHEIAVRLALGASRLRLIREQMVEGALVAGAGGFLGILVARLLMIPLSAEVRLGPGAFGQLSPRFSVPVILAAAAATVMTLFVFGLIPAIAATRSGLSSRLAADGPTSSLRWRGRHSLISAQVTVSTVLVALAFLCAQQIQSLARKDFGLDLRHLAAAQADFRMSRYGEPRARLLMTQALQQIRTKLGVGGAAIASTVPMSENFRGAYLDLDEKPLESQHAGYARMVTGTSEMFKVFGIPILRGREFDDRDSAGALPVGILSEHTARQLFGTPDAVGRQLHVRAQQSVGESEMPESTITIVGIVGDPNDSGLGRGNFGGYVFRPWEQDYDSSVSLVAWTPGDPSSLPDLLRRTIRAVDPDLIVLDAGTGIEIAGVDGVTPKIMGSLSGLLGGFALALSLIGLYGILSHLVAGRTREIGVRMALGAQSRSIIWIILRQGLDPVISGLIFGLLLSAGLRLMMGPFMAQLFPAIDPLVLLLVPVPFLGAALLACYVPAHRAARVDPMVALREL